MNLFLSALGNVAPAMAISIAEAETRRGTICAPRILKCQRKGGTAGPACGETPVRKLFYC